MRIVRTLPVRFTPTEPAVTPEYVGEDVSRVWAWKLRPTIATSAIALLPLVKALLMPVFRSGRAPVPYAPSTIISVALRPDLFQLVRFSDQTSPRFSNIQSGAPLRSSVLALASVLTAAVSDRPLLASLPVE